MDNTPLLSVIVPCYNAAHLIIEYLNQISESTNLDLVEFIIVDDCSKDDSFTLLKEYASHVPCRIVIGTTKTNSGPGTARNIAINLSRGKYMTFLDADDRLTAEFYEKFNDFLSEEIDLVVFDYDIVNGDNKRRGFQFFSTNHNASNIDEVVAFVAGGPLGKIYKSDIIKSHKITYLDQKRGEDIPFTKVACSYCKTFLYINEPFYEYIQSESSIMHDSKLIDPQNGINAFNYITNRLSKEIDPGVLDAIYIKQFLYGGSITNIKTMDKSQWKSYVSGLLEDHPGLLKNKYFYRYSFRTKFLTWLIYRKKYTLIKLILYVCGRY